jgi:hypothetical protein
MSVNSPFRWAETEADATKALELSPRNLKALFRRSKARKELGKWDQAREGKDSSGVSRVSSLRADQLIRHSDVH